MLELDGCVQQEEHRYMCQIATVNYTDTLQLQASTKLHSTENEKEKHNIYYSCTTLNDKQPERGLHKAVSLSSPTSTPHIGFTLVTGVF